MFCTDPLAMLIELPGFTARRLAGKSGVTFLRHRDALGDNLMLTALARGLKKARPDMRVLIVSQRPKLFLNNPHIDEARGWHLWRMRGTVRAHYDNQELSGGRHAVEIQWQSLWQELGEAGFSSAQTPPPLDGIHPEVFLTPAELGAARWLRGQPGKPLVLLSSGGKLKPTHNREWGVANYQAIADALAPFAELIQITGETPLRARGELLRDLRQLPVREAAALLAVCDAALVQEGGLMHLARAVNAPVAVIFGGYALPEQTGYPEQINFWKKPECSPCIARRKDCPHLKCMVEITPRRVLQALAELIKARCGFELPGEVLESASDHWTPPEFVDRGILEAELAKIGTADERG